MDDEENKIYIGDGVYASFDSGFQIKLETDSGGLGLLNTIYLEPGVFERLLGFAEKCWGVQILVQKINGESE